MDNNRALIIQRALVKNAILTPLEVMNLQYLARKAELKIIDRLEKRAKPYAWSEPYGILNIDNLKEISRRVSEEDPRWYNSYEAAYDELIQREEIIGKAGNLGLCLLTQIASMRRAYLLGKLQDDNYLNLDIIFDIPDSNFVNYSIFHNKKVTFQELLGTFANIFRYLIKSIDNILTLNYFLDQIINVDELECLKCLKMWLLDEGLGDQDKFHPATACCDEQTINLLVDENHEDYIRSLECLGNYVSTSFIENSMHYVKRVIMNTIFDHLKHTKL